MGRRRFVYRSLEPEEYGEYLTTYLHAAFKFAHPSKTEALLVTWSIKQRPFKWNPNDYELPDPETGSETDSEETDSGSD